MPRICDRSPCDRLLEALGKYIFGAPDRDGGFYMTVLPDDKVQDPLEISVDYCPFCGTRMEEVPSTMVERFTRPRKRRRAITTGSSS